MTIARCVRCLSAALALGFALSAAAQQPPPDLQPLPEPPPPPPGYQPDPALEPQVTILQRGEDTIEEFRINGVLYAIRVTPPHGHPYYLIDNQGDGRFVRKEDLDSGLRPPLWLIHRF